LVGVLMAATLVLSSCATNAPEPMPEPIAIPVRPQPAFEEISYSTLPAGTTMVTQTETSDVLDMLRQRFKEHLVAGRSGLTLHREDLVLSGGKPYRRIWIAHHDGATWTTHGTCNQNIHVWFAPSGLLAQVFVEGLECPI
jgi:hypothetical protein